MSTALRQQLIAMLLNLKWIHKWRRSSVLQWRAPHY